MCPISAVFGVRSITIHSPRRTRALCWSRSRADILWYRVQMGAHEWSWKDFSLTSTWRPKSRWMVLREWWSSSRSRVWLASCQHKNCQKIFLGNFHALSKTFLQIFQPKKGFFGTFLLTAWKLGPATELLHEVLHHPLRTVHLAFGLNVDVSEKSFQDHSEASICPLCAKLHHPNPKNKKVMKIYSQISIKSNPLIT